MSGFNNTSVVHSKTFINIEILQKLSVGQSDVPDMAGLLTNFIYYENIKDSVIVNCKYRYFMRLFTKTAS